MLKGNIVNCKQHWMQNIHILLPNTHLQILTGILNTYHLFCVSVSNSSSRDDQSLTVQYSGVHVQYSKHERLTYHMSQRCFTISKYKSCHITSVKQKS